MAERTWLPKTAAHVMETGSTQSSCNLHILQWTATPLLLLSLQMLYIKMLVSIRVPPTVASFSLAPMASLRLSSIIMSQATDGATGTHSGLIPLAQAGNGFKIVKLTPWKACINLLDTTLQGYLTRLISNKKMDLMATLQHIHRTLELK